MIYIYGLKCPVEGVIRYVGKSVQPEKRIRAHLMGAQRGDYNHRTARWLRKIAKAGHEPELMFPMANDGRISSGLLSHRPTNAAGGSRIQRPVAKGWTLSIL